MATTYIQEVEKKTLLERLSSRKFIATVFAAVFGVLVAAGVVDANTEQSVTVIVVPVVYILVEGVLDFARKGG